MHFDDDEEHVVAFDAELLEFVGDRDHGRLFLIVRVPDLGEQFATERNRQVDAGCGSITNVRRIVTAARKEGLLDHAGEDEDE